MTADGPLAGTGDTVTYTYDASGFVATITDEVALLTQVIAKNASGQPLTIVDPNNVTTTMTYDERNRLKTITVNPGASQLVTSFDYYLDGDIKRITRPDSSYFDYTYDDARRLTLITNNSGEKIELGYDLMGNVTSRTVKDSASTITYSHTQMFDELGRTSDAGDQRRRADDLFKEMNIRAPGPSSSSAAPFPLGGVLAGAAAGSQVASGAAAASGSPE